MKTICLALVITFLLQSDCDPPTTNLSATRITVYSKSDLYGYLAYINQWIAPENIVIEQTTNQDNADITIMFGNVEHKGAKAVAFTISGEVRLTPDVNPQDVLHEILHIAGLGHESDPNSIMYIYSAPPGQKQEIYAHHIDALRNLAGVTSIGRLKRQITVLGDDE